MEKLSFDTGIKEYEVNGKAVLRFNPGDQNVYARFVDFYREINQIVKEYDDAVAKYRKENPEMTRELDEKGFDLAAELMEVSRSTDKVVKEKLIYVFGEGNDFDAMFEGVNMSAMTDTGGRVIENFLEGLLPIIETNAEERQKIMQEKTRNAVENAQLNRAQRRALGNGQMGTTSKG